jgi:hypothetical protein
VAQFAEVDDLAAWVNTPLNSDQALLAIQAASVACQTYTRQTLELVEDDEVTLVGNWSGELELPERPVVSVSAATINDFAIDYLLRKNSLIFGTILETWIGPDPDMGEWGGPTATVAVTYTHGFDPIPEAIRIATLMIAARIVERPDNPAGSVTGETIGSYAYTIGQQVVAEGLLDAERALLKQHRRELATTRT